MNACRLSEKDCFTHDQERFSSSTLLLCVGQVMNTLISIVYTHFHSVLVLDNLPLVCISSCGTSGEGLRSLMVSAHH